MNLIWLPYVNNLLDRVIRTKLSIYYPSLILSFIVERNHESHLRHSTYAYDYDSTVISSFLPAIKVHCWGGFGSQLYSLIVLNRLNKKFPFRRVMIVFHDGGVTRRKPEVLQLLEEDEFEEISDFSSVEHVHEPGQNSVGKSIPSQSLIHFFKFCLVKIGFISECNSQAEFAKLSPWVLGIRGHYTKLLVTQTDIEFLFTRFCHALSSDIYARSQDLTPGLHFRLGDLLSQPDKKPIPYERVCEAILILKMQICFDSIRLFSDSLPVASSILNSFDFNFELDVVSIDQEIFLAFPTLVQSCGFIATPSKVSEWVVLFRHFLGIKGLTLIPKEMVAHFHEISPEVLDSSQVQVY